MASALEKRIAAIEEQRQHTSKRRPKHTIRREGERLVLVSMTYPVGRSDWREATPEELIELQAIMDRVGDEF